MKTYEQFVSLYETKGILDLFTTIRYPTKPQNEKQLKAAYEKYVSNCEKKSIKKPHVESEDAKLSKKVRVRDTNCRLTGILNFEETKLLKENAPRFLLETLDVAHVFGKGANPKMRYNEENVVLLNRFSHNCLDTQKCPLTGKAISLEQRNRWWIRIVGSERYQSLLEESYNTNLFI